MDTISTTRMSSKGQIVIPEGIRKQLNLQPGDQFIVVGEDNVVILKAISAPGMETFDSLIDQARKQAADAGLKRTGVAKAISKARRRK
ncbi:MAG: AbrB/MazE/SpoVT family DNA-binding domain-containing protein [Chloroflexota bacterium]